MTNLVAEIVFIMNSTFRGASINVRIQINIKIVSLMNFVHIETKSLNTHLFLSL